MDQLSRHPFMPCRRDCRPDRKARGHRDDNQSDRERARCADASRLLYSVGRSPDDHRRAHWHQRGKPDDVGVSKADAPVGDSSRNQPRLIRAVDPDISSGRPVGDRRRARTRAERDRTVRGASVACQRRRGRRTCRGRRPLHLADAHLSAEHRRPVSKQRGAQARAVDDKARVEQRSSHPGSTAVPSPSCHSAGLLGARAATGRLVRAGPRRAAPRCSSCPLASCVETDATDAASGRGFARAMHRAAHRGEPRHSTQRREPHRAWHDPCRPGRRRQRGELRGPGFRCGANVTTDARASAGTVMRPERASRTSRHHPVYFGARCADHPSVMLRRSGSRRRARSPRAGPGAYQMLSPPGARAPGDGSTRHVAPQRSGSRSPPAGMRAIEAAVLGTCTRPPRGPQTQPPCDGMRPGPRSLPGS